MDVCEFISQIKIDQSIIGMSGAMKILTELEAAGLVVVVKPNYSISVERGGGEQTAPARPKLSVVPNDSQP
jgi:hypothetical protein